ncbi:unnamed protein product [Didymodactylos carnosus]|uniref:Uncharacterized protein n=1 Tax=Didymodactylos carnosus TaxID=1234261 RepID=A0A814QRQ2_9BILA|nr:unnamed protein product [Didymodactylos carnosus]CAF3886889.1 unnamed protein product [Didymodactylos carnosus]
MSNSSLQSLMKQIDSVAKANDEIIKQIDIAKNSNNRLDILQYVISQQQDYTKLILTVQEVKRQKYVKQVIDQWHQPIELIAIQDIFNDRLNYRCIHFNDLAQLNKAMFIVVQKYKLFGDTDESKQEVEKFLFNFQSIHDNGLKQIQKQLDAPKSDLEDLKKKIDDINYQIENMANSTQNITFQLKQV